MNFKSVTPGEFESFLASYPRKLERNVNGIGEPPAIEYHDFSRAPYAPDSLVASYIAGDGGPSRHSVLIDIDAPIFVEDRSDRAPLADMHGKPVKAGDRIRAHWGMTVSASGTEDCWREDTVVIRDEGTPYERWSFEACYNNLRGFEFEVIAPTGKSV